VSQLSGNSLSSGRLLRTSREPGCRAVLSVRRPARAGIASIFAVILTSVLSQQADAMIVGHVPNVVPNVTTNPVTYPGWTQGDPGWNNVATSGNYTYLGDGWVLSARHYGYNKDAGITFQTASGPVTYQLAGTRIVNNVLTAGPYYLDYGFGEGQFHQYAVSNPASVQTESGQTMNLTAHTDLQLFRINGDPGLPALTIASQPLPSDFTRANAPAVVMMGAGFGRAAPESHWNVTQHSQTNWEWNSTSGAGQYQGYTPEGPGQKRWGTNRLTDPFANGPEDPSDPGAIDYRNLFNGVLSDTAGVMKLTTGAGMHDIISSFTIYDQQSQPGTSPPPYGVSNLEAQAIAGDSGAPVFYKRGSQWELTGIVNSIFFFPGQPSGTAVYGNATTMTNLSYYNQEYLNSIQDIIESHPDYSIVGDVNLDGLVSGNGTGAASIDDVTAFILGWQYDNGLGQGTITSWKSGDMNRDGKTDVLDFLRLRAALNGQISDAALAALFGGSAVPEPSTLVLAILACVAPFSLSARRRRSATS
jgi:hypothetical protein